MKSYSLSQLADRSLLLALAALLAQDRSTTALLLAHIAEVDERKLYLPAACPSMFVYCVRDLRMSEDMALKYIRAARTARRFPQILPALADGRLHLSAVVLLAPHLEPESAGELLALAAGKTRAEIEQLIAERFPRPDAPTRLQVVANIESEVAPGPVGAVVLKSPGALGQVAPKPALLAGAVVAEPAGSSRAKLTPLSPGRYALQVTINQTTHDLLHYAQSLLGHSLPSGDLAQVLERALGELVEKLERQKFARAAGVRPRRGEPAGRHVPAEVRRTVWQRDQGRCTFVSDAGQRCQERTRLEFDHLDPVARGGRATAGRMRLLCRAHNQYFAEQIFGAGFMREKRQGAREQRQNAAREQGRTAERERHHAAPAALPDAVAPWLRQLGFSAAEARRGAERCAHLHDAPLEQRVKLALRSLAPAHARIAALVASAADPMIDARAMTGAP